MVNNSGDTQARFLAKSLAFLLAANCAHDTNLKKAFAADCADERRFQQFKMYDQRSRSPRCSNPQWLKEQWAKSAKPQKKQGCHAILRRTTVRRLALGRDFSETTVSTTAPVTRRLIRRLVEVEDPPRVSGLSPNKAVI
jgi:hypothetical protein